MRQIQQINIEQLGFHEGLQLELSSYPVKLVQSDSSVIVQHEENPCFLINDIWNINFLVVIPQFQEMIDKYKGTSRNIHFEINSPSVNLEVKYVWYQKLFREEWALNSIFGVYSTHLRKLTAFLNEKYPALPSLLDLDIEKTEREWWFWLEQQGISTQQTIQHVMYVELYHKTAIANFLGNIYSNLFKITDTREEWEKDQWDVRLLHDKYGVGYNKSRAHYHLDFSKIEQKRIREQVKKYIKQRLLSKNNFSWSSAQLYLYYVPKFLSYIFSLEPTWTDIKGLKRTHMEQYIESLHTYSSRNIKQLKAHSEKYVSELLSTVGKFLEDIQRYEFEMAPETHVRLLIFPEDKPKQRKKSIDQIDYIPDFVLEQLFTHINELHKDVISIVWVAFKTGLRISDVLGLTLDCLERLNKTYSIVTDIEKTYVQGHRIPIDEELANILAVLIQQSRENSNEDNNPDGFIFIRYRGSRKGKPYAQNRIREQLNTLAREKNIVDENGNLFHFKTHQFRHTYAVKMLNGGADILTVQELLAHASPEMTLRYARLLDDTKRKAFESVINQGVFSFDLNGDVQEIKAGEDIPQDILQVLWQDHKLNVMENPTGCVMLD
jgi:integrase